MYQHGKKINEVDGMRDDHCTSARLAIEEGIVERIGLEILVSPS
jgi:hypothetical protein